MSVAAVGLTLGGISAASSIAGGVSAQQAGQAEAKRLREAGQIEAADRRRQTSRLLARQTVAFAASGIDVGTGTPLQVLADTVAEEELAALRIEAGRTAQAESAEFRGDQALIQGVTGGITTVLGSAAAFSTLGGGGPQTSGVTPSRISVRGGR